MPVCQMFEFAPSQRPFRERGPSDGEAHTRRLPGDAALLRDRFGGTDNAARDEALTALVLAREHENRVAFGDMLTAIHCLRAVNANVFARGSRTSALIANTMPFLSRRDSPTVLPIRLRARPPAPTASMQSGQVRDVSSDDRLVIAAAPAHALCNDLADAALDIRDRRLAGVGFPPNPLPSLVLSLLGSALRAGIAYSETIAAAIALRAR